jgi:methionine-rich copper-binding protein CopC
MTMRRAKRTVLAALLLIAVPDVVFAHAQMTASVPKDGAVAPAGLSEIEMSFSKPLRLTVVHVMQATERKEIPLASELPKSFVSSAKLAVGALTKGAYEVTWTAVADDGHVMNGSFKFSVSEAQPASPAR